MCMSLLCHDINFILCGKTFQVIGGYVILFDVSNNPPHNLWANIDTYHLPGRLLTFPVFVMIVLTI